MTKPQINVTPLIDVLLVLLIIFMVVTPMKPSAFEAKIPAEPDDDPMVKVHPDTLIVSIGTDSKLRLNRDDLVGDVSDPTSLIERLREVFDRRTQNGAFAVNADGGVEAHIQKTVFIKAPRGLDYGSVAKVVDAVKIAGANPVSLQIDGLD
ncbi:MAG TPA: biopolymer transporter ExbD [Pyrinomonadaceae bacterium]|nr:biopolymer transporter ExbD [Pyrinomonadaceae bacterium]